MLTVTELPSARISSRSAGLLVSTQRQQNVEQLADYVLDPVKLDPAVAALSVTSNQPGTLVLVDGLQRGVAPMTIPMCVKASTSWN